MIGNIVKQLDELSIWIKIFVMKMTINHVNKIIYFSKVSTGTTSQFTRCYFGYIGVFEVILVVH